MPHNLIPLGELPLFLAESDPGFRRFGRLQKFNLDFDIIDGELDKPFLLVGLDFALFLVAFEVPFVKLVPEEGWGDSDVEFAHFCEAV